MSIEGLPLEAAGVYRTDGPTGALVGVQPVDYCPSIRATRSTAGGITSPMPVHTRSVTA
jgi:hypothetical protein